MARIDMRGISIGYDDLGGGDDVLLLIHGHPFDRTMWQPQTAAIVAAGWRVITPDLRGYGESTVAPGKTTLDVFADDLIGLLDALGIAQVVVGGLSMGGQIAMELARRHAHRLRGLVLAATFPRVDTPQVQRYRCDLADRLDSGGKSATELADELLPKMLSATSIQLLPDVAAFVHAMMRRAPARGAAAALRGRAERPAYESTLASFAMPSLILVGDSDAFTTRDDAEQMHDLLRHSRLVRWPGVGHMPNLELPQAFNGELVSFLETLA